LRVAAKSGAESNRHRQSAIDPFECSAVDSRRESEVELRGNPGDTGRLNPLIKSGGGIGPVNPRQPS
jgi:hypothetical protein